MLSKREQTHLALVASHLCLLCVSARTSDGATFVTSQNAENKHMGTGCIMRSQVQESPQACRSVFATVTRA